MFANHQRPPHDGQPRSCEETGGTSLRSIVQGVTATMAVLLLLSAAGMGLLTTFLHRTSRLIDDSVESVRLAMELQQQMTHYNGTLALASAEGALGSAEDIGPELEAIVAGADRRLGEVRKYVGSPEEEQLLREVAQRMHDYFAYCGALLERRVTPGEAIRTSSPLLNAAMTSLQDFVDQNSLQAQAATRQADVWDSTANVLSIGIALLAAMAIVASLVAIERSVHSPLAALERAIERFGRGDKAARAQVAGPSELRSIAGVFNGMADSLVCQEENQLTFIAGVAHDLRNPLTALRFNVDRFDPSGPAPTVEEIKRANELVARQVHRMDRLVGDLLDATRIHAGRLELKLRACDVSELAREAAELFRPLSSTHEITVSSAAGPVIARCDATRIAQVLNNLISNAIKYSPQGGEITVSVGEDGGRASVTVADRGMGIEPEEIERIFEPFRRASASRELVPGVGLGLWLARRIAEAHGGSLSVSSVPGQGSVFRLELPLAEGVASPSGDRLVA
ncbi:HAMP domain-containing sensor histidine kinase [Sorangium sp. So ce1099]|uniref:HAMP domain-containing sensor histidine kinase n=1 Tax=Sorangium sp. So ce1099 TaxID=3133331 RepID=UPI003F60FCDD